MTFWKVPGAKLVDTVLFLLKRKLAGQDRELIDFDPELEVQLSREGFDVSTVKSEGNYYTFVRF